MNNSVNNLSTAIGGAVQPANGRAVLLIHGFGDTPQSMEYLARFLTDRGYIVSVPLLPGHGTSVRDFDRSRHQDWISTISEEYQRLRAENSWVAIAGLSMGGALAAITAAREEVPPDSLCLLAPYLKSAPKVWFAAKFYTLLNLFIHKPVPETSELSIRDAAERARNLSYGFVTPNAVHELVEVVEAAQKALPLISSPTLIIQSRLDNRIPESTAQYGFKRLKVKDKKLIYTDEGGHVITVDYGKDIVFSEIYSWLEGRR